MLIDDDHRARLSDFGLANFDRSRWLGITSNSSDPGGTTPYMAPELFHREHKGRQLGAPLMKKEADVYALGMLIYEVRLLFADFCGITLTRSQVLTGKRPFHDVPQDTVEFRVSHGERPRRPSPTLISDQIWKTLQACWSEEPTQRPTVEFVLIMCAAHPPQNVPAMWRTRGSSICSGGKYPSRTTEVWSSLRAPSAVLYHPDCSIN